MRLDNRRHRHDYHGASGDGWAGVVEFSKREDVSGWLKDKPPDVSIVIAARAGLRVIPTLATSLGPRGGGARTLILPTFRALAMTWLVVGYPSRRSEILDVADSAARITEDARSTRAVRAAYAAAAAITVSNPHDAAASAAESSADAGDTYVATSVDARAIQAGMATADLAHRRLWLDRRPRGVNENWTRLKRALLALNQDWQVWTEWYEERRDGLPAVEALEVARVMIANEVWEQGPKTVNAEIRRLIDQHEAAEEREVFESAFADDVQEARIAPAPSMEAVPSQGPGPRFHTTDEGPLDRAPPADFDAEGNDIRTIDRLRPLALRCAADLRSRLPPNQFGELLSAVDLYVAALDPGEGKTIEWGEVWGQGVILQNAATAAERKVEERILPALEDPAKTALESLLTIHGPMILASRDGAKFSEAASEFRLTREQQEALRAAAQRVADQLKADKDVITPRAAASVAQATESIGEGPHPERGSVYGLATVKNISIVLVGGAAIASPMLIGALLGSVVGALAGAPFSLVAVEAVKKSAVFNALVQQLGGKLDAMTDVELRAWLEERSRRYAPFRRFVARNAEPLRKIAEATPELKWMLRYIDFISGDKL